MRRMRWRWWAAVLVGLLLFGGTPWPAAAQKKGARAAELVEAERLSREGEKLPVVH